MTIKQTKNLEKKFGEFVVYIVLKQAINQMIKDKLLLKTPITSSVFFKIIKGDKSK